MLESETLTNKIYDHVVAGITSGEYPPKSKLTQSQIAQKLDISHVPVREAMYRLQSHGWIERIPMKGAYVKQYGENEIREIYQTRELFETFSCRLTAQNNTPEQMAELSKVMGKMDAALLDCDRETYSNADLEFHRLIAQFAGNKRIASMYEAVLLQSCGFFDAIIKKTMMNISTTGNSEGIEQHRKLYEAIGNHDAEQAEYWAKEHIKLSYKSITAVIGHLSI